MIKPKTKQALNAFFLIKVEWSFFSMGAVCIQSDPQKPAPYHVFSHLPTITLKSLFLYYNLQTISSKRSLSPSFSPANKAIPKEIWAYISGLYLKPGEEMDSRVFCSLPLFLTSRHKTAISGAHQFPFSSSASVVRFTKKL